MIIHYFNISNTFRTPDETDPKLIIDANRVLSIPVAMQCFKPVAWRNTEIRQFFRRIHHA